MAVIAKILLLGWLYLSVGYGVVIIGQVLAYKVEKLDDYYDWYVSIRLDVDDPEFGLNLAYYIIFWPFVLVGCSIMLVEVGLKKLMRNKKK